MTPQAVKEALRLAIPRLEEFLSIMNDHDEEPDLAPNTAGIEEALDACRSALESLQAAQGEGWPVGEAEVMPGTEGFTMAAFKSSEVPVGTKLYAHPLSSKPEGAKQ